MSDLTGTQELLSEQSSGSQGLEDKQSLRALDRAFATWTTKNFCLNDGDIERETVDRLAKAVSYALHLKHTCLDLAEYSRLNNPVLDELLEGIDAQMLAGLGDTAIGSAGSDVKLVPLVRSSNGQQLWLHKYYCFEQAVVKMIAEMNPALPGDMDKAGLSDAQKKDLDNLYKDEDNKDQRVAVETTLSHRFSVITGGPGTGKTYTVARIIALMVKHGIGGKAQPRIALAAPTGKAANRMRQSLNLALEMQNVKELIGDRDVPREATTLHSLLKIYRGSPKARRNPGNPLPVDVLIIDEASMIDLPMMYRVLSALPADARLILLGDKDQLASVEAGSVLGALCDSNEPYIATIKHSYRYIEKPEIGELAVAINRSQPGETPCLPDFSKNTYVTWSKLVPGEQTWSPKWLDEAETRFTKLASKIVNGTKVSEIMKHQTDFQILCALRKGPAGVSGINSMIERRLGKKADGWYSGRPVMVLSNDHQRKLYNGDVGLVLPVCEVDGDWFIEKDEKKGRLRACFPMGEREIKAISLAQMPASETCYAMTVHKSQGSEYRKVLLILPADRNEAAKNPVITKELLYTGATRASESVEIWSGEGVMEDAAMKPTVRMSGLGKHTLTELAISHEKPV